MTRTRTVSTFIVWCILIVPLSAQDVRKWTDISGKHQITAQLIEVREGVAKFKTPEGKSLSVPIAKLSQEDQLLLAAQQGLDEQATPSQIVEAIEASVVYIDTGKSIGSGFVATQNIIVTNYHVIDDAREAKVSFKDKTVYPVKGFLGCDIGRDVALLWIEPDRLLRPLPVATELPKQLEAVIALGAPKGFSFTASQGNVSAIRTGKEISEISTKMVGLDIYGLLLNYGPDATWVQSTAAISGGSSGGPLVNTRGEVVGINTWTHRKAESMHFASSCTNIQKVLAEYANAKYQSLLALPQPPKPLASSNPAGDPTRSMAFANPTAFRIELPTGTIFSSDTIRINVDRIIQTIEKARSRIELEAPNGGQILCCHQRGVPHGPSVGIHPTGRPSTVIGYDEGRREEAVKTWDDQGQPVYYCQYDNGKPNGLCCLLRESRPVLALEYQTGQIKAIHFVKGGTVSQSFANETDAMKDVDAAAALEKIRKIEDELEANERRFRKLVREQEEQLRRQRVSVLNPQKRANIGARLQERNAKADAAVHALRRQASGAQ
jgi:S1-C subfamily serine protease